MSHARSTQVTSINSRRKAMLHASPRRLVKVTPPTIYAGVGNALREAFSADRNIRPVEAFEDLLARLN